MNISVKLEQETKAEVPKVKKKLERDTNKPENTLEWVSIEEEEAQSATTIKEVEVAGLEFTGKADRGQSSNNNKAEFSLIVVRNEDKNEEKDAIIKQEKNYRCGLV